MFKVLIPAAAQSHSGTPAEADKAVIAGTFAHCAKTPAWRSASLRAHTGGRS